MAAPGPPKDKESLFICLFKNPFYSLGDDAIISTENNNFILLKNSLNSKSSRYRCSGTYRDMGFI